MIFWWKYLINGKRVARARFWKRLSPMVPPLNQGQPWLEWAQGEDWPEEGDY